MLSKCIVILIFFFFKQKTAYEMRISDGSSDVCSSDLPDHAAGIGRVQIPTLLLWGEADPISPVALGEHLQTMLPNGHLHVVAGGDHGFARDRAEEIAP